MKYYSFTYGPFLCLFDWNCWCEFPLEWNTPVLFTQLKCWAVNQIPLQAVACMWLSLAHHIYYLSQSSQMQHSHISKETNKNFVQVIHSLWLTNVFCKFVIIGLDVIWKQTFNELTNTCCIQWNYRSPSPCTT